MGRVEQALPPCSTDTRCIEGVRSFDFRTDISVGFVYTPGMSNHHDSARGALFSAEARRKFYEGHRSLALFMILVVFAAPFAGLYVAGLLGVVVGVLVSAAAYVLTPYLWQQIRG